MIDKVRKGMECCVAKVRGDTVKDCSIECPYFHEGVFCKNALHGDVEQIIQQLETTLDGELQQEIDKLESRLAQVERERDAAVQDVWKSCEYCKHSYMNNSDVDICPHAEYCSPTNDKWEWRGVFPENTKEDENGN